ncbi:MAG TPA: hypothetical protein VF645_07000 [Allosphingosinicella sp.]|jgi:hypothetical protein
MWDAEDGLAGHDYSERNFYTADWGQNAFIWIAGEEPHACFHINLEGTMFRQREREDEGGGVSGVHLGEAHLAFDASMLRPASEGLQQGDIVITRRGAALACEGLRPHVRPVPVQFARAQTPSDVPYDVICSHWSLFLRDVDGDLKPYFQRRMD